MPPGTETPIPASTPVVAFFHQSLPAEWQWIALLVGIIALVVAVMALPTVAQMMFGGPEISLSFVKQHYPAGFDGSPLDVLECHIMNQPIQSRLLKLLRVRRETVPEAVATYSIREFGTNRVIREEVRTQIKAAKEEAHWRMPLAPSDYPYRFGIAAMNQAGKAHLIEDKPAQTALLPGSYVALAVVESAGDAPMLARRFVVGNTRDEFYWA